MGAWVVGMVVVKGVIGSLQANGLEALKPHILARSSTPDSSSSHLLYRSPGFHLRIYQSSSSSFRPCMLICLALNASAKPPAKLGALTLSVFSGVFLPLPPLLVPILTALSLGAGGGAGFLPPPGRFGGAGGVGFAFAAGAREAVPLTPLVDTEGGGAGTARTTGWGGAGGGTGLGLSSVR